MGWDLAKLAALSAHERHQLWQNARKQASIGSEAAKQLIELIENSGLDYLASKKASISIYDPIGREIWRIISSDEGRTKALAAQDAGLPPLAAVDPLLKAALGDEYSKDNEATSQPDICLRDK